jgi:N-succinyldiaminopimelate aminotransferase
VNPQLDRLFPYPFERLRVLLDGLAAGKDPINMGIGEPQHPTPSLVTDAIKDNLHLLGKYPPTAGMPELKGAISDWIARRYAVEARHVIPVAGTREALFGFAQAVIDPLDPGVVLLPNPFYQIYEGAAFLARSEPFYVPTPAEKDFLPDWNAVPTETWNRVKLVYVCSPGNPAGAVFGLDDWREIFELSDKYGFVVAADECYSEIYNGEPPMSALQAAQLLGRGQDRIVSFNSLSKRSSAPGLRSGFVAGDPKLIDPFLLYRTYHGAAPSSLTQASSIGAWRDEAHVEENRRKYQAKFLMAREVLPQVPTPAGGFFLWMRVEDDVEFARRAYVEQGITVLPGSYLARDMDGHNPGAGYVRVALVAELDVCAEALERLGKISS